MSRITYNKIADRKGITEGLNSLKKELLSVDKILKDLNKVKISSVGGGKELKENQELLNKYNKLLAEQNKISQKVGITEKEQQKAIDSLNKQRVKAYATIQKQNELEKKRATNLKKQEVEKAYKNQKIAVDSLNKQRVKALQTVVKEEFEEKELLKTSKKQWKSLIDLNKQTAALTKIRARLDLTTEKGKKEFDKLTNSINKNVVTQKKYDEQIGRSQLNVGNYPRGLMRMRAGMTSLVSAITPATIGLASFGYALKEIIGLFSTYSATVSKVAAVSNATTEEVAAMDAQFKYLGKTTQSTANEMAELGVNLAKLGFSPDEIIKMSGAIQQLSVATGEDLAQSAEVAGATLRTFGLDASKMQYVVDIMAKSFSTSALDLERFRESMKLVAPISKAANIPLNVSTKLLGKLADAGLHGSIAGTSLKNLLSKLSDENSKLSKELGFSVKNTDDLAKAFILLKEKNIDLTKATELTDERSKAAFLTLIDGIQTTEDLTKAYEDAAGSAQKMSDTMADNLDGDAKKATSAMQGLGIEIGEKLEPIMRVLVKGFTFFISNIKSFIKILTIATTGIISYTLATKGATIAKNLYTKATKLATLATKFFSGAIKISPIGLFVTLITSAAAAFLLFRDNSKKAIDQQKKFNDEIANETAGAQAAFEQLKRTNEGSALRLRLIKEINTQYGTYLPNLLTEKSNLDDIELAQKAVNDQIISNIALKKQKEEITSILSERISRESSYLQSLADEYKNSGITIDELRLQYENFYKTLGAKDVDVSTSPFEIKTINAHRDAFNEFINTYLDNTFKMQDADKRYLSGKQIAGDHILKVFTNLSLARQTEIKDTQNVTEKYKSYIKTLIDVNTKTKEVIEEEKRLTDNSDAIFTKIESDKTATLETELDKRIVAINRYYDLLSTIYTGDVEALKEVERQKTAAINEATGRKLSTVKNAASQEQNTFSETTRKNAENINIGLQFTQIAQNAISQNAQNNYNKEAKALDDKLNRGIISQKQYDRHTDKLNKEFAKKQKRNAILSSMINTALAVTKVMSQTGTISPFVIPLILAEGAAQLAVIQGADYEEGGLINQFGEIKGKRHSQGGEPLTNHINKSNVEHGELVSIFSRKTSNKNFDEIQSFTNAANNDNLDNWHLNFNKDEPTINNIMYQNANIEINRLIKEQRFANERLMNIEYVLKNQKQFAQGFWYNIKGERSNVR